MNNLFAMLAAVTLPQRHSPKNRPSRRRKASPMMVSFTDLKWIELPERKGMQFAVLSGDPRTREYTQMRRSPPDRLRAAIHIVARSRM
jgi:hypothetical protein